MGIARERVAVNRCSTWNRVGMCSALGVSVACASSACQNGSKGANPNTKSVFSALNNIPTPEEAARMAVDPYDADKRQRGILLLANAPFGGERVYVELYEAALSDEDSGVRLSAIRGLMLHGTPEDALRIAPFLEDDDRLVRWEAARALQRIHNPEVVKPLMDRLDRELEPEYDIRASAATALGQYAERRVVQALIASLRDPSLLVTQKAAKSLHTLTGQELQDDPRDWTKWLADAKEPFAGRLEYEYPVFSRDRRWYEWLIPFYRPQGETPGEPVGMASANAANTREPDATTEGPSDTGRSQ